jgi:site-specific recombinase XerC
VQRLVDQLVKRDAAAATIDSTLTPLRALYRRAVGRGDVQHNPTRGIEKPAVRCKVQRVASPPEAAALIGALGLPTVRCGRRRSTPDCAAAS